MSEVGDIFIGVLNVVSEFVLGI